tara:strand:+ start:30076 stop:30678 length:603 start_codon:yes stop_codon:yes gene_type:complete
MFQRCNLVQFIALVSLLQGPWAIAQETANGTAKAPLSGGAIADEAFDLFPVGKPWESVRVPSFDENDILTSILHTKVLTRESKELLHMLGLTVVMFQKNGDMSLRLITERGVYDVNEEKLKSREKTFIQHPQFDMHGDKMIFDTRHQNGKLNGNVEMVIYDMERAAMPIPTVPLPEINTEPSEPAATSPSLTSTATLSSK